MSDELLRDLAKDLPFERPTAARRDAIRSSLLVEAAESTAARPVITRRWPIVAGFAAGALAAAAIAVLVIRRPTPVIERANLAQVTATTPDVRIDHQIIATDSGSDEIIRIREGTLALAIPAQRRGDRMIVKTTTAEVEGDAGELEVVVANEQLQSVRVKAGTAKVIVIGQTPVILSAGQTWRASVITADLLEPTAAKPKAAQSEPTNLDPTKLAATDLVPTNLDSTNPDPTVTGPTKTEPTKSKLANIEPTNSAPTADPTISKRANNESTKANPAKVDPTKADPAKVDPTKADPTKTPANADPSNSVAAKTPVTPEPKAVEPAVVVEIAPPVVPAKPASIEQRFQQGWALLRAGKAQQAADELGAAADASPSSPLAADARYFQAVALVRANDPRTAERVLVQFLDSAPKSLRRGRAAVLLGRLLAERGDPRAARAWLETAATDPDPAIAAAAKAGLQSLKSN